MFGLIPLNLLPLAPIVDGPLPSLVRPSNTLLAQRSTSGTVNNPNQPITPPGTIITPTQLPVFLPDQQPAGSILRVDVSKSQPQFTMRLPRTARISELAALEVILPEYGFLATDMPDCSQGDCVLFSTSSGGGMPNPAPIVSPALGGGAAPNPGIAVAGVPVAGSSQTLQTCQSQVRQIQSRSVGDRTASIYQKLHDCYESMLSQATSGQQVRLQLQSLNNLGVTAYVLGEYRRTIDYHQRQLKLAEANQDGFSTGMALAGIGAAYGALGDYDKALAFYEQALQQLPEPQMPHWRALVLRNVGNAYLAHNDSVTAIRKQVESLKISTQYNDRYGEAQAQGNLGNAYAQQGQFDASMDAYANSHRIAVQIRDQLQQAQALLGLGTTSTYQQRFEAAVAYQQQSLTLMRQLKAQLGEGITLTNLGDALFRLRRLDEAANHSRAAVQVWEALRAGLGNNDAFKVSIFETQRDAYRNLQEVLVAQNQSGAALEVAERGRARAFIELLARRENIQSTQSISPAPPNLAQIKQIAQRQKTTIVQYSIMRDQFVPVRHGTAVQFTAEPQESAIFIWVVQPTGQVAFRRVNLSPQVGDNAGLSQLVIASRSAIGKRLARRDRTDVGQPLRDTRQQLDKFRQLHQLLIQPIADLLPSNPQERVAFIPQEQLFLVPFAALQNQQNRFLIEQHTVMTAPAIQLLGLKRRSPMPATVTPLVVGNPSPMPSGFDPLPGSENEARTIANLFNVSPLIGGVATETGIKQEITQARVIHLATHGVFDEQQPLRGSLLFAATGAEDGFLTADELLKMSLNADLVVLSACDTGRGRITGDGVIGLSRSWLAAGAASVVVSLWAIDDAATTDFMTAFYQSLKQRADKVTALRSAMLATMAKHPNPDIWAAFTLIGEPD